MLVCEALRTTVTCLVSSENRLNISTVRTSQQEIIIPTRIYNYNRDVFRVYN